MRRPEDIMRSVKKYVNDFVLPADEGWEVRIETEEGAWQRPFCRVGPTTPVTTVTHNAQQVESRQGFVVVAFHALPDPAEAETLVEWTPDRARFEAARIEELFFQGFHVGRHTPSFRAATRRGHPRRVPIWDYAGVAWDEPATTRDARDFARIIEDPSIGSLPDPNEEISYVTTVELRLGWWRSTAVVPDEVTVVTVGSSPGGP